MNKNLRLGLISLAVVVFSGCASQRPILYDNATYKKDPSKAEAAIETCMQKAASAGAQGDGRLADSAERAAKGATASAAAGGAAALAGGSRYDVGGSMGMSAAAGGAGNFALGMMDNQVDPILARYVETCLLEKGYRTVGWK